MAEQSYYEVAGYFQSERAGQPSQKVLPARPEPIAFNPAETAVIVVDLQNAYASKNGYLDKAGFDVSTTAPVIAKTIKVLEVARANGMPVVFFQNGWDPEYHEAGGPGSPNWYKSNALKTMRKQPELMGTMLAKGTWDYDLVDELKPQPGDMVIPKPATAAFLTPTSTACCAAVAFVILSSLVSPPMCVWNRPCVTASFWSISALYWKTRLIRRGPAVPTMPHCLTLKPFSAGSPAWMNSVP